MAADPLPPRPRLRLSTVLAELCDGVGEGCDSLTLGELLDRTAHAGFGFLIALLALLAVPLVGLSTPFGLAIGFVGMQMLAARDRPWLPRRLRDHVISRRTLGWLSERLAGWTARLERVVRPRLTVFACRSGWTLVGLGVVVQGLGLALPLPIPGSNWIFLGPILVYALGLLEDDGALILIGHGATLGHALLAVTFWQALAASLGRLVS